MLRDDDENDEEVENGEAQELNKYSLVIFFKRVVYRNYVLRHFPVC